MDGGEPARRINPMMTMMRFRPIAPKPVAGGTSSAESKNSSITKARTKRKYVRVRRYNRKRKISTVDQVAVTTATTTTATLQLLPEFPGGGSRDLTAVGRNESDVVLGSDPKRGAVELWVTVECVTDACMGEVELGCTDEERMRNLEEDTCPGFVSDGADRVEWLNGAFRRMVRQRSGDCEGEIGVRLVISDVPKRDYLRRVFTCQIKLQFKRGTEMEKDTKLVPCDAWRMDGGGFAWKLDVKAALTLAPLLQEDFQ